MERTQFTSGEALSQTWALFVQKPQKVVLAVAVMAALGVFSDSLPDSTGFRLTLPIALVTLFFQYQITRERLDALGLIPGGFTANRFPALFGLNILSGLGTIVGLILLIVPGVFLGVRWALAAPILIAEESGVTEAMKRSWHETEGRFWLVFIVLLVVYSPMLLLVVAGFVAGMYGAEDSIALSVVLNVVVNAVVVLGWHAAIAIYALTRQGQGRGGMADIFA